MSGLEDIVPEDSQVNTVLDWLEERYHVLIIAGLFGFMVWVRARTWDNFIVDGEVLFSGNDAWYHLRQVKYTVHNWPSTMPFDRMTEFPTGTFVAQFGTVYDQIVATVALVVGLGSPSEQLVELTHLFSPAIFGAAIVVPTYYLGKQVGDRLAGVFASVIVALSSGILLRRSLVGFADHQAAEAFFQAVAVLAVLIALEVAQREKPIYDLLVQRDWEALRRPLAWAIVAGSALSLYMWTWPPGVFLIGILGIYVTIQLPVAYVRGESPEHLGIPIATMFAVAGILSLGTIDAVSLDIVKMSVVQPGLALAGAVWVVILSWLARKWDKRDIETLYYPASIFVGLVVVAVLARVILPELTIYFYDQILRFIGFNMNPSATGLTVGEVQPMKDPTRLYQYFGVAPIVAGAGVVFAFVHQFRRETLRPERLFVAIWFVFMVAATFTQQRFAYYLTVPTATMVGLLVGSLFRYLNSLSEDDGIETYQILVVSTVIVALILPMVLVYPVHEISASNGPGGVDGWDSSLSWMNDNTPAVGDYGGAGNEDQLEMYGTYTRTDDFEYPNGAYGVMSWWDYGHWITELGERVPVANPFQAHATEAANFLTAMNESNAEDARAVVGENATDAEVRYVMSDWKMAVTNGQYGGKFFAPATFRDDVNETTFYRRVHGLTDDDRPSVRFFNYKTQAYYETMTTRLYRYHGSAASPTDVPGVNLRGQIPVFDWDEMMGRTEDGTQITLRLPAEQNGSAKSVRLFTNMTKAENFVEEDGTAQIGGLGKIPSEPVSALQHYRLVQVSEKSVHPVLAGQPGLNTFVQSEQFDSGVRQQLLYGWFIEPFSAWTKVFERVDGATIEGQGPANRSVTASVEMNMPNADQTFIYRQHAETNENGDFTMTVPYSTQGYENWGPSNGYTNVSVRANSSYKIRTAPTQRVNNGTIQFTAYNDTVDVTEAQVIGQDESATSANLTYDVVAEQELSLEDGNATNETNQNSANESTVDSNESNGTQSDPASLSSGRVPAIVGN